jgi:hypothetical protein
MKNKTLNDFKENVYSQFGEDGIIKEILRRLGIASGICVEFGAWDGVLLSNTAKLWTTKVWKGVLIEPGKEKFEILTKVLSEYDSIALDTFIKPVGEQALESVLKKNKIQFDEVKLISIDIDGNEYHILKNMNTLRPPLIIAEYNPTIPPDMEIVSKEDAFFGSSAKSLTSLMEEKGYGLVAMTKTNCFFVDNKYFDKFSDLDTSFESIFDKSCLTYLITGYKGAYAFSQYPAFGIGLPLNTSLIQKGKLHFQKISVSRVKWNYMKDFIKVIGKKIIGVENISRTKMIREYIRWKIKGMPIPPPGMYKWKVMRELAKKHNLSTFVETGTAGGGTVKKMSKYFKKLYTVELDPTLFHQGKAYVSSYKNITCLEGDSGIVIKDILNKLDESALFWLDAHYSGRGTAKGETDTPIEKELQLILKHRQKNNVVMVDDVREFDGRNDYPALTQIVDMIKREAPWYKVSQISDLLIIEPTNKDLQ